MTSGPSIQDAGWAFAEGHGTDIGAVLAQFLPSLTTRPRLLGFGEPLHGEESFLLLRNRLFRHLAEYEGYRSIALESDCLAGMIVDRFVAGGTGNLDDVMRDGFSHGFGAAAGNRELVRWMRDHNQGRADEDRLRFYGFDAPTEITGAAGPRQALTALHGYLAAHVDPALLPCTAETIERLAGADERWTDPAAMYDPAASVGSSEDVAKLRLIADDLQALCHTESPHLLAATSPTAWWEAQLYARTATGLLRYHAAMADPSPARLTRLTSLRDGMMAANLESIVDEQQRRGPAMVFAHNLHLQRDKSRMTMGGRVLDWWSAGALAGTRLHDRYAFIAMAVGSAPAHGLGSPREDTLEGVLASLPENGYLIDSSRLAEALRKAGVTPAPRVETPVHPGYFPLDPGHFEKTDGIAFLKEVG
ncbi:erythromycin esterase family protein [Amycolatopsis sp. NPDC059021]|uniref:erythromycin esterase family protein n=1 Tax=Amycolatopsis sp. NPDC059021 TaxID=3346704 RepID=UPI0036711F80